MNILYTCDNNYIWNMGISMISLFENNKDIKDLDVYLLGENITIDNKKILSDIAQKYQRKMCVIDTPNLDIPATLVSQRWPTSAFARLFSGQLLPQSMDKILYLDCDTIVAGNISELKNIDLGKYLFGGVKDCIGGIYKQNIGLANDCHYINAGVLYINLVQLRSKNITALLEKYLKRFVYYINYADQDILNGVFYKDICILPPEYNVMTIVAMYNYKEICALRHPTNYYDSEKLETAISSPKIIHYTTNMRTIRPWYKNTNHPFAADFQKYKAMSPWKEKEPLTFKFKAKNLKIIGMIQILPKIIANCMLGFIHSELKPRFLRYKAKKRHKKNGSMKGEIE